MFKAGYMPGDRPGWLRQANKLIEVVEFIELQLDRYRQEMEVKNGR